MSDRTLILEIGTEEIPAAALVAATKELEKLAATAFEGARLGFGKLVVRSTPRRIILEVANLAEESNPLIQRLKGPAVAIAFDSEGKPTKAALGFARGKGVGADDLVRGEEGGKEYVFAIVQHRSRKASDILPGLLSELISSIYWPKSQRWGSGEARFSRPVRWLLALWGDEIVPVEFAGLTAHRTTRGHRLLAPGEIDVPSAESLIELLSKAWVVPSASIRSAMIRKEIAEFEAETGLTADVPEKTFLEVVNLVEYPTVLLGHFDEEFLEVPSEIITDAMLSHQRYFPMYTSDGRLSNAFLLVSNGAPSRSVAIVNGNERVVRARLSDAAFFYHEDLRRPLESYVADLDSVVFQEKLGTVAAKVNRVIGVAGDLAKAAKASDEEFAQTLRAALLAKADLVTSAVVEFTSLQGVMGGYYALAAGEDPEVAIAVTDHYHPRFSGDELPRNFAGRVVALADKLDTICGIFAIGQGPTGSSDPFALRRGAIGIVNILLDGLPVLLSEAIDIALDEYDDVVEFDRNVVAEKVRDFFISRIEVIARDRGYAADTVAAVLAVGILDPLDIMARCDALQKARDDQANLFEDLATAYTRANNLADSSLGDEIDPSLLGVEERVLLDAICTGEGTVDSALQNRDYPAAISALASLRTPVDAFFEAVLIMDPDDGIRENRLRLLNRFVDVFSNVADMGKLGG